MASEKKMKLIPIFLMAIVILSLSGFVKADNSTIVQNVTINPVSPSLETYLFFFLMTLSLIASIIGIVTVRIVGIMFSLIGISITALFSTLSYVDSTGALTLVYISPEIRVILLLVFISMMLINTELYRNDT